MVVQLAFSRKQHALPPLYTEPAAIGFEVAEHEGFLLAALSEVMTSGARRADSVSR